MTGPVGALPPTTSSSPAVPTRGPSGPPSAIAPWTDSQFWILQVVILALVLIRLAMTVSFDLAPTNLVLELSTIAIFFVPVVIAALRYGLVGGLATVAWIAVLSIPGFAEAAKHGDTAALWAEVFQVVVLAVLAGLIGQRVSAEATSRDQAESALQARLRAEMLYEDIFESNRSPILIVDADGYVVDSNTSADRAFGSSTNEVQPLAPETAVPPRRRLVDVVGPEAAAVVLAHLVSGGDPAGTASAGTPSAGTPYAATSSEDAENPDAEERVRPVAYEVDGQPVLYRPTATLVGSTGSDRRVQVIFEDVTTETRRHDLMEAYAGQVVLGQEEERRHIAQELHDGPLQTLIHLCRQIDSLDAAQRPLGTAPPTLASLRTTVEETVAELRSLAKGLRPSVLDDLGLVASINQVLTEATDRQGFQGQFDVSGSERRLPPAVELALFRIAQEAVTNAERHATAAQVTISLEFADDSLRLLVEDDGVGFDQDHEVRPEDGHSLGLPGMGERARLVGGRLKVRSQPGRGTTVEVLVPTKVPDLD